MPATAAHVQIDRIAEEKGWERSVNPRYPRMIRYLHPLGHTVVRVHLDVNGYLYDAVVFAPKGSPKHFCGYRPKIVEGLRQQFEDSRRLETAY